MAFEKDFNDMADDEEEKDKEKFLKLYFHFEWLIKCIHRLIMQFKIQLVGCIWIIDINILINVFPLNMHPI